MVKKKFHTPEGIVERDLTKAEEEIYKKDIDVKKDKFTKSKKDTVEERLTAIEEFLDLK